MSDPNLKTFLPSDWKPKPSSERVATYNGYRFTLIKREGKRLFIKQVTKFKPVWINESQVTYRFDIV